MSRAQTPQGRAAVGGLVQLSNNLPKTTFGPAEALRADKAHEAGRVLREQLGASAPDRRIARVAKLRRSVGFAARLHGVPPKGARQYCAMVTLTYADGAAWQPEHITDTINLMRKWLAYKGVPMRYVWVAELQKRGAIHYHIALWLPPGITIPKADKQEWWQHGHTRTEAARDAPAYLLKYLSKGTDTSGFPKGARIHGVGGLGRSLRRAKRWLSLPAFVKARSDIFDDWRPAKGGGWATPDGHVIPSEYERTYIGGAWACLRVADYGRPFQADGPFTWLHRGP